MKKYLFVLLPFLVVALSCRDDKDVYIPGSLAEMQFDVRARASHPDMHADLFPSFLYLAGGLREYYKDEDGKVFSDQVLELSFPNPGKGTVVELAMRESELTGAVAWSYTTGKEDTVRVSLPVEWKKETLRKWNLTSSISLVWEARVNDYPVGTLHQTFRCHDIREFPERIFVEGCKYVGSLPADEEGAIYPAAMFPAYVHEDDPVIGELLEQAVADGAIDRFDGYARGEEQVVKQLGAMWYVLLERNMTYGNHYFIPGYWSERYIRRLRFADEVLKSETGNCMELPMLIMAMCKQAGIKVVSFHIDNAPQDHMFVGILNADGEVEHILNPAFMVRMDWGDWPREERVAVATRQLVAYLKISESDYEDSKVNIANGVPHYEMVDFDEARKFIPSLD